VGEVPRIVVAAPSVLAGRAGPQDAAELSALPWLALRTYYRNEVSLVHEPSGETRRIAIRPSVSTDSLYALRSGALLGLGAALGSAWLLADDLAQGRLVHLAPQWHAAPLPVYIVYPHARFYPSRLLRFVATMREDLSAAIDAGAEPRA
jgi:DNA-binding transcriptional LysR family regulator